MRRNTCSHPKRYAGQYAKERHVSWDKDPGIAGGFVGGKHGVLLDMLQLMLDLCAVVMPIIGFQCFQY